MADDPLFSDVTSLIQCIGPNSTTSFKDDSPNEAVMTSSSGVNIQGNRAQFPGSGKISTPATPAFDLSAGNPFTVEAYVEVTTVGATFQLICGQLGNNAGNNPSWNIGTFGGNFFFLSNQSGNTPGDQIVPTSNLMAANTRYHLAWDFDGTDYRLFQDGVMIGKLAKTTTIQNSTYPFTMGLDNVGFGQLTGYIDNVRITNGTNRYGSDSSFTPPTTPYDLFTKSYGELSLTYSSTGWAGYTLRQWIDNSKFAVTGNEVIVTIRSASAGLAIDEMYIGLKGSGTLDFASAPTQITFDGGNTGKTVGAFANIVSDPIAFDIDGTQDIVFSMYIAPATADSFSGNTSSDGSTRLVGYLNADDPTTLIATGYNTGGSMKMALKSIFVAISSASPTIVSLAPTSGADTGGTPVTITGTSLTGTTDVQFDGVSATSIVVVDDNTITCDTPAGTIGAVDVEIFNPAGNYTLPSSFTYYAATLVSILPTAGIVSGGTSVTITGTLLTGATDVQFDGISATSIVVVDDSHITCDTPAHSAGTVDVQVFTPTNGDPILAASFTYAGSQPVRATQAPVLVLDTSGQPNRVTQAPLLILYQEEQPNRVTQTPVLTLYTPKPVPLPKPVIPDMPLSENWGWLTVVGKAHNGQEWRSRLREVPRYKLQMNAVIIDETDRRNTYNMMMRYLKTVFLYPMFQYNTEITAPAETIDTKIFCTTALSDFRAGEFVAVFDPELISIQYLEVSTVDSDGVNLVSPLTFDIPTYWQICPAFNFRIAPSVGINMNAIGGSFSLVMESTQPRVFQRPGAAPTLTEIDGILIIPERPLANDVVTETFNFGVVWYDNNTSVPDNLNQWANPRVSSKISFLFNRKTGIDYWRAIIDTMKGQQNVALFPTFRDDLPLREAVALDAVVFTTANIDFFIWWTDLNYRYLMIDTENGAKYRRIISVDPHYDANGDPDYIFVTLADSIGNVAGDNDIKRISYMNLYRLNDDSVTLTHFDLETQIDLPIMAVDK